MSARKPRHRHPLLARIRAVDPQAVAFGAVCGLIAAGGILALLSGHPIDGIG